jgi:hypothetical protein
VVNLYITVGGETKVIFINNGTDGTNGNGTNGIVEQTVKIALQQQ